MTVSPTAKLEGGQPPARRLTRFAMVRWNCSASAGISVETHEPMHVCWPLL